MDQKNNEPLEIGRLALAKSQGIEWLIEHRKVMFYGFGAIVLALVLSLQLTDGSSKNGDFMSISQTDSLDKESISVKSLEEAVKKHPELHTKLGSILAQRLLSINDTALAEPYAQAAFKRIENEVPYHAHFAKTSLLISKGSLAEALDEAKRLKNTMSGDEVFWSKQDQSIKYGSLLFAYNLLRIAILEMQAGSAQGELLAWQELKKYAGWAGNPAEPKIYDPEAYVLLQKNFQEHQISLLDFIQYREKVLNASR